MSGQLGTLAAIGVLVGLLGACGPAPRAAQEPPPREDTAASSQTSGSPRDLGAPTRTAAPVASAPAPPSAEVSGSTVKLSYGGRTHMLSEGTIVTLKHHIQLVFREPEAEGLHEIRVLLPEGTKLREAAKIDGSGKPTLFLQLAEGRAARDVSSSCSAKGTVTVNVIAPDGHGKIDVTIACTNVQGMTAPFVLRGDFYDMKYAK